MDPDRIHIPHHPEAVAAANNAMTRGAPITEVIDSYWNVLYLLARDAYIREKDATISDWAKLAPWQRMAWLLETVDA